MFFMVRYCLLALYLIKQVLMIMFQVPALYTKVMNPVLLIVHLLA